MMKLLIVDDDPEVVEKLRGSIRKNMRGIQYRTRTDFDDAESLIVEYRPDVIILDLLLDNTFPEPAAPGLDIRTFIWERQFCPIIVHSARPGRHDESNPPHPFVTSIQKGPGSDLEVVSALRAFRPHVEAIRNVGEYFRSEAVAAMRDIAPQAFRAFDGNTKRQVETTRRAARRRLAARMDEPAPDGPLAPWEIYLCPPVSDDIRLGDIVRKAGGDDTDPESFAVVLTPSCDLVTAGRRTARVDYVLAAQCTSTRRGLERTSLANMRPGKLRDRLGSQLLAPGHLEGIVPFPEYHGKIPTMVADLRKLRLVAVGKIGKNRAYERIASIDSPFRELVAWAYMQTAARPGLPERDFRAWRDEILADIENGDG